MITRQNMIDKIEDYLNTRLQAQRNATGRNWQRTSDKHYTYKLPYDTLQLLCESADDYFGAEIINPHKTGVIVEIDENVDWLGETTKTSWQEYNYNTATWEARTKEEYIANLIIRIAKQREKITRRTR